MSRKHKNKKRKTESLSQVLGKDKNYICEGCGRIIKVSSITLAQARCAGSGIDCQNCGKTMRPLNCKI